MNFNFFYNVCEIDLFVLKCTILYKFKISLSIGIINIFSLLVLDEYYVLLFD